MELLLEITEKNFHELCIRIALASENLWMSGKSAYKKRIAFSMTFRKARSFLEGRFRPQEMWASLEIMGHFQVARIEIQSDEQ
jgi:hypothetical protein